MKLRITECHLNINKKKQLLSKISIELKEKLSSEQWNILEKHNQLVQNLIKTKTTSSHRIKLDKLRPSKQQHKKGKEVWIKNLSNKQLTSPRRQVLEKGLNFAVTPDAIPHLEFVASVEKGFQIVKNLDKVTLARSTVRLPKF